MLRKSFGRTDKQSDPFYYHILALPFRRGIEIQINYVATVHYLRNTLIVNLVIQTWQNIFSTFDVYICCNKKCGTPQNEVFQQSSTSEKDVHSDRYTFPGPSAYNRSAVLNAAWHVFSPCLINVYLWLTYTLSYILNLCDLEIGPCTPKKPPKSIPSKQSFVTRGVCQLNCPPL